MILKVIIKKKVKSITNLINLTHIMIKLKLSLLNFILNKRRKTRNRKLAHLKDYKSREKSQTRVKTPGKTNLNNSISVIK